MHFFEIDEEGTPVLAPEEDEQWHGKYAHVEPVPGTLILFPGWLSHAVAPHSGDGSRTSVSFNVFLH